MFVAVGRKGAAVPLPHASATSLADFELKDSFTFLESKSVAKFCMEKFLSGEVDKVTVVFTDFVNTLTPGAHGADASPDHDRSK